MPVIDRIKDFQNDLVAIRRDIHAHPEIGFEETRTSAIVADLLETWGITVHRGVGGTGVVGELRGALLQTWGTAARRHPVGGLGSIGEMLIEHNHGFGQGRGSNSECSFNQAHLPHDTWLQAPCLGLSFA